MSLWSAESWLKRLAGVGLGIAGIALLSLPATGVAGPPLPPANAKWDYEIGPAYTPPSGVTLVSRDREANPAPGLYNICYVNAYQTQPNEVKWWKNHHRNLLLKKADGHFVVDSYWGEILLDISTRAKRHAIADIVNGWMDGCAVDGTAADSG